MKNQHNSFHVKHQLDSSTSSDKDYNYSEKQSYKLYSSQRLTHAELHVTNYNHPKSEATTSQIYQNLNNSLDGLFSKIEALKQEHTIQQKNNKINKKINMDVSNFPMPNLAAGQFTLGKPLGLPTFVKPRQKRKTEDKIVLTQPFQQITQDSKAVSPPTQHYFIKSVSSQNIYTNQYPTKDGILETRSNRLIPYLEPQTKQNLFNKNNLQKGLLNMQNLQMKVSMEVSDFHFKNTDVGQGTLRLDKIIEKQAKQTDFIKKSIIFNHCNIKDFQLGKNVGSGKFGDVHICRHKQTGFMFALKKIFKSTILQYNMINQFTRQLKIHYRLDHPNIIKLYSHFDDQYHIFLLMEYAQGGILMNKLKCTQQIASRYVDQTIDAVQYLHKLKIAHRDIKPQNIVLQFTNVIKLCDFGWASNYENEMKTTFCGTLDYLSPQMKQGGQYDNSVDIWSVGVLIYQLLTGNPPYRKQLMLAMKNGVGPSKPGSRKVNWTINYPSYISPLAQSFIRNLLKENPEERATLRLCSTHTFIKKYQQNLQILVYYDEFNKVISYNNQSPQKFGSNNYLAPPAWTATNINPNSRGISAFNYAFNSMNI